MNKTRRLLTILLALCLAAGAVPFAAFSATTEELANRKNSGSSTLVDTTVNAVSDYIATAAADTGAPEKPADGTTTGNPFPKGTAGSTSFRIPALVTLSDGTLVAAADARWNTTYDGGGLDTIVARRAKDSNTWNYTFANYLGDNGNAYSGSESTAFIDPALAVTSNDTIYMLVDLYPYGVALNGSGNTAPSTAKGFNDAGKLLLSTNGTDYSYYLDGNTIYTSGGSAVANYTVDEYFNIFQNGTYVSNLFFSDSPYKVVRTGFLYLTKSTDKGASWSAPTLLNVKNSSEMVCLVGPGRGLVTKSGTIVFPVYSYNGSESSQRMGFIYSTDNGNTWSRSAELNYNWASEAAVVELEDGTLRFFFRNGSTYLYYVDYKNDAWGTPQSTGIHTNSNCQISAITYSRTMEDGKQVILVSCPAGSGNTGSNQSGASYRVNGKIFAFTVEDGNALTHKGTISVPSVNSTNNFMYSCLTEQEDGIVSILYEDNEAGWGTGDGKYYQMSYKEYDVAAAMGLTFDAVTEPDPDPTPDPDPDPNPDSGPIYIITDKPYAVTADFASLSTDVTDWTMSVVPTTQAMTGVSEYIAFDITIQNDQGTAYTGPAQVSIPLSRIKYAENAYPFIVTDGNVQKINDFTVANGYMIFTAPHFSVMGVAVDEPVIDNTQDGVNGSGSVTTTTYELATNDIASGQKYLIVYQTSSSATSGYALDANLNRVSVSINGQLADPATDDAVVWEYSTSGNNKYLNNGSEYLYPYRSGSSFNRRYYLSTSSNEQALTISKQRAGVYRIRANNTYVAYSNGNWIGQADSQNLYFYLQTTTTTPANYTVTYDNHESRINAGTLNNNTGYTAASWTNYQNALTAANAALNKIKGNNNGVYDNQTNANTDFAALQAAVTNLEAAKTALVKEITITVDYQLNGVTVFTEPRTVTSNDVSVTLEPTILGNNGESYLVNNTTLTLTDALYYTVPVRAFEIRYVEMHVGETKTDRLLNEAYTTTDVTQQPETEIATLDSVVNGTVTMKNLVEITATGDLTDGQYLIVNVQTGAVLTDTAKSVSGTWADKSGLKMETAGSANLPHSTELWTITNSTSQIGRFILSQDGKYLTVAGYYAGMSGTETHLVLAYVDNGWKIYDDTTWEQNPDNVQGGHKEADYYLHHGVGDNYTDGALGANSVLGENGLWKIYRIAENTVPCTDVTFTGEDIGQTIAIIGDYKYVVTVIDPLEITVNYTLGDQVVYTDVLEVIDDDAVVTLDSHVLDADNNLYTVNNTTLDLTPGTTVYNIPVSAFAGTTTAITMKAGATQAISATKTDGQSVTWHTKDDAYAGVAGGYDKVTVDEETTYVSNGNATIAAHKETEADKPVQVIGLIHDANGTVVGANVWDVTISGVTSNVNDSKKDIKITASWIEHSTVYYNINGGALQEITPDMLDGPFIGDNGATYYSLKEALIDQTYTTGFQIMIFAAPEPGYALTFMNSTNSDDEYYSLLGGGPDGVGSPAWPFQSTYDYTKFDGLATKPSGGDSSVFITGEKAVGMRWGLVEGNMTVAQLQVAYATAIEKGCTGVLCFTRNGTAGLDSDLTIVSEKIATVEKTVAGILATSGKQVDYRPYEEGMVAGTGELVFFNITVSLERPTAWNDVDPTKAALEYVKAELTDELQGAYIYDQDLDKADGTWNGVIDWNNSAVRNYDLTGASAVTKAVHASGMAGNFDELNIKDALNAPWGTDEMTRDVTFTVVYQIQDEDIPKYTITNTVTFDYSFNSKFSIAENVEAVSSTLAKVTVVTKPMEDILIDFTQPITISGLTNDELKYAFGDLDKDLPHMKDWYKAPEANYGTVSVTKIQQKKNGELQYDGNGYPLYDYTLTYTPDPTKGMMRAQDVVRIYGTFVDVNTGLQVTKLINAFAVYPATTIYYEEDYIKWDDKWTAGTNDKVTGDQHLDYVGDADKQYNYGYDPVYNGSNVASNGTQATTSTVGASGTFDFTGTGFEIYANCTEDTGYVMVLVTSESGQIRLYTVNTKVDAGSSAATNQQSGTYYSVPIVSVHDLAHDSYNVRIVKSTDYGEDGKPTTSKAVNIDAVRIFQTMDPETSNQIYDVDGERNPSFVELRDLVLTGVDVEANVTNGEYPTTDQIISQVYSDTGSLNAVVWINSNPEYTDMKDLLENGPKNELYLWPSQAVTFTLNDGVTAQIGMKTVSGSSVTYTYNGASHTINSSTDMFYHNPSAEEVTITNNSGGVLSITLLKYWGASTETLLAEVSESQIAYALLSLRELPAKDAVLHVTAVDYTGEEIGAVRLSKPGAEGEYAVFTREELLAQLPDGYLPVDEVTDIQVAYGEELSVTARIGKVAMLKVEYVRLYKHGEVDMGGKLVPVMGKKIITATLSKVQTGTGDAVFTAQEIRAAAPVGAVLHGLSDIQVAYGQTEVLSVFDTQSANTQVVPSIKL